MSRAQRQRSLASLGNAYGITMRAIEEWDGRSLAMQEDARANAEGAPTVRVPSAHTDECNRLFAEFQASVIGQGERAPAADDRGCECETRECVPGRYAVNVYDRAGEFTRRPCSEFATVLETAKALREKYPGKVVLAFNLDRCDYNTDGLTEDEAEALNDAASEGIANAKR